MLLAFHDALTKLAQQTEVLATSQVLPLAQCRQRFAASDISAPIQVPPAANSAMDGYALRLEDWQDGVPLPVSQRIPAGHAPSELTPETCARIFTGAEIPPGANCVVMQENTEVVGEALVQITKAPTLGDNIRPAGQDIETGQTVLRRGEQISARHIGMLASLGITEVAVYEPLKVGVLTTGDELIMGNQPLGAGQIYNSNGPMLCALIEELGHQVVMVRHSEDKADATIATLKEMDQACDVILSSGGVSVGEEDHVKNAIETIGSLSFWKVNIKPGKPLLFGQLPNAKFIGLPGNPSSTLVTFHLFARYVLTKAAGGEARLPLTFKVKAGFTRSKTISRDEFIRCAIQDGIATPHPQQSSGALFAACATDGYLHVPANHHIDQDSEFDFFPFSGF